MSLLGREYLSVTIEEDPPGGGDVRPTTRTRRVVTIRRRLPASAGRRMPRPDATTGPRRATR